MPTAAARDTLEAAPGENKSRWRRQADIPRYCHRLREVFLLIDAHSAGPDRFSDAADWLQMASGVNEVKIDISRFDDSGTDCRGAYEFDTVVEAIRSALATELVRFTFAWAAFECVALRINLKKSGRFGVVDRAIAALNVELSSDHLFDAYEQVLIELWDCVNSHEQYGREMQKFDGGVPDHIGGKSVGLHLVRVIRNKFAHGDYVSREPSAWGEEEPGRQTRDIERESKPIALSTYLVLMSIQIDHI